MSEDSMLAIFDDLDDGFMSVDGAGRIRKLNRTAESILGLDRSSIEGRSIDDLLLTTLGESVAHASRRAAEEGRPARLVTYSASRKRWTESRFYPDRDRLDIVFRDVTEEVWAERRLATERECAQAVMRATTTLEAARELLHCTGHHLAFEAGAFWQLDAPAGLLHPVAVWTRDSDGRGPKRPVRSARVSLLRRVIATGEGDWVPDSGRNRSVWNIGHASAAVRVDVGTEVVGLLEYRSEEHVAPDPRILATLAEGATCLAGFIRQRSSEQRYGDLVSDLEAVVWEAQPDTLEFTFVSQYAESLLGYPRQRWLEPEFWISHLHPDDRERVEAIFRDSATHRRARDLEYRLIRADGEAVWVRDIGRFSTDWARGARLRGVMVDMTGHKQLEKAHERAFSLLSASLDSTADGLLVVDDKGKVARFNQRFVELWHLPKELIATGDDRTLLAYAQEQLADPAEFMRRVTELYDRPEEISFDVLYRKDGRVFERYSRPQWMAGEVVGRVWSFRDVTDRVRAEKALRFLADASEALASSLDYRVTLNTVAGLAIPAFADWCTVDLRENHQLQAVAAAHRDPRKAALLRSMHQDVATPLESGRPAAEVVHTGKSLYVPEVTSEFVEHRGVPPEHRSVLRQLGVRSLMVVPLVARGDILGAITFASGGRAYDREDLAVVEDLARRAALAVDNARLFESAVAGSRAKSDFLAVMSHELRTPLTAILGFAEILEMEIDGPVTDRQKERLSAIKAQALGLSETIDEILTFSRMETGRDEVRFEPVDLREVIMSVGQQVEPLAERRGLDLKVSPPETKAVIISDGPKIRHLLMNLLSNALKFTEEGEIELSGRIADGSAVLQVRDTGIGIEPKDQQRVLEPFYQVDTALTREIGGTGLGLAVANRIARALNGGIELDSRPGQGSTFTIILPVRPDSAKS